MSQGSVTARSEHLAQLFLRYASPFSALRRLPILGPLVSWVGAMIVPRDLLTWVRIQQGPAAGLWLRLNPRTGYAAFQGTGELSVQRALQKHLRPGMNFYDIGANIGFFTLLGASLVGEKGRVTSFEADPEIAVRLREHITRNRLSQVTVEEKAVWSEGGVVTFSRSDANVSPDRGLGHVVSAPENGAIEVKAVSLDEHTSAFPVPDFLKCDVEGAEVEVFRGAHRLLTKFHPGILCEMHSEENRRILLGEFARLGYQCTPCGENHVLAVVR